MLIGARPDSVAGGEDYAGKMVLLKEFGYDFFELPLTHDEIASLAPDAADEWRAAIERAGLPILATSMGHFGGFAALPLAEQAEVAGHARSLVRLSRAIGADTLLLATHETGEPDELAAIYRRSLLPVAEEAAEAGIILALEHVRPYKPHALAALVRALDHPAIRIYFDIGNCLTVGESPIEQAQICAPMTAQLHLKGGPTTPLAAMPLAPVREILAAAGFRGRACLEIPSGPENRPLAEARGLLKMAGYC